MTEACQILTLRLFLVVQKLIAQCDNFKELTNLKVCSFSLIRFEGSSRLVSRLHWPSGSEFYDFNSSIAVPIIFERLLECFKRKKLCPSSGHHLSPLALSFVPLVSDWSKGNFFILTGDGMQVGKWKSSLQ